MQKKKSDKATPSSPVKLAASGWEYWIHPEALQKAHEEGNPSALDLCVVYCHQEGKSLPDWVLDKLAQRSRKEITKQLTKTLDKKEHHALVMAAVDVAEGCKFKGDDRDSVAEQLLKNYDALSHQGLPFITDNIKKIWERYSKKDEVLVNDTALCAFSQMLLRAKRRVSKDTPGESHADKIIYELAKLSD